MSWMKCIITKVINKLVFFIFILNIILSFFTTSNCAYAKEKEKVVLQLRWDHQFQFSGYYMAKWLGYYDEEGLDVEIRSAFPNKNTILHATKEVSEGRADFGVGAGDILIAQNRGANLSVVASIFQRSAVEFCMKSNVPFNSVVDFINLNTARRKNDLLDIELQAMLYSEGINPNQLPLQEETKDFSVEDLISGRFDVVPGYLGTIPFYSNKVGLELKVVRPIDFGIDFYGDSLFTRRSLAIDNPELVEKFRRASIKGWQYALEHPDDTVQRIVSGLKAGAETKSDLIEYNKFQSKNVSNLTLYPVVEIGNINPYRWSQMNDVLLNLKIVDKEIDWNTFIFDYEKIQQAKAMSFSKALEVFSIISFVILATMLLIHITAKKTMIELEKAFEKEMEENKRKEALIIYQARLAAMGEMIANIAHQWRQPLNNLGLILSNVEDAYVYNELDKELLHNSVEKSRRLISRMSHTIDDFRYFLNPKNKKEHFSVYESISTVIDLLEENLRFNNIKVNFEKIAMNNAYGYANQFSQAVFNIISNSIDALKSSNNDEKEIIIAIYEENDDVVAEIRDNGGGISQEIGDKIFDIYFTTKQESKGTGLGLYITKMIIENNLNGKIQWRNMGEGVLMKISIPGNGGEINGQS
jgi:signal transduction histidine kinase